MQDSLSSDCSITFHLFINTVTMLFALRSSLLHYSSFFSMEMATGFPVPQPDDTSVSLPALFSNPILEIKTRAQSSLSFCIFLFRLTKIPVYGFSLFFPTRVEKITIAQPPLDFRVPLLSCQTVPLHRLLLVLLIPSPQNKQYPSHPWASALIGGQTLPLHRLLLVL